MSDTRAGCIGGPHVRGEGARDCIYCAYALTASDLRWAMGRIAMVGCTCRWDEDGNPPADCRCDERPDWVRYREIKDRLA